MRVAAIILAVLVFAALLILDTAAVLELLGDLLWAHALAAAVVVLLVAAAALGWTRLRPRKGAKQRGRTAATKRPTGPRKQQAAKTKGRSRAGKTTRAK